MPYALAAAAAFALLFHGPWRRRQAGARAAPTDPSTRGGALPRCFDPGLSPADVGASLSLALKRLLPVMTGRGVRVDVAVCPGLLVPMAAGELADLMEELLAAAVHQGSLHPACERRLLVTGMAQGGQIHIGVTDDAGGADPRERAADVERLLERAELRGAVLDIEARPAEGTTMTLRLAAATDTFRTALDKDGSAMDRARSAWSGSSTAGPTRPASP